jgi:hypothetical protein
MSAFFGFISKKYAIIASDTLCSFKPQEGDSELLPRSYTCKTFLLPQYKSAFAITGTLQAALCFFNNTVEFTYGIDVDSLVNIDLVHFRKKLESDYKDFPTGTIYLLGYSFEQETFKGFKLLVDPKAVLKWGEMPIENLIFKPLVESWEEKLPKHDSQTNTHQLIIDLMKLQKQEDKAKQLSEQVGIGGEIVCTELVIDNQTGVLTTTTQIIHQFNDYLILGDRMANNK